MNDRDEPPALLSGGKIDPLQEIFSSKIGSGKSMKSPPPRFSEGPVNAYSGRDSIPGGISAQATSPPLHAAEAPTFNRSDLAAQIRQSFDNLVKASPIGVSLMTRTQIPSGSGLSTMPTSRSPLPPPSNAILSKLSPPQTAQQQQQQQSLPPLPIPRISFGGFSLPPSKQSESIDNDDNIVLHPSALLNHRDKSESPSINPLFSPSPQPGNDDGEKNDIKIKNDVVGTVHKSFVENEKERKKNSSKSTAIKRELKALLQQQQQQLHLQQTPTRTTTIPVLLGGSHSGELDVLGEEDVHVSRYGRASVKPLAYWSSERLIGVGLSSPHMGGIQGIQRGSAHGDLLYRASAGPRTHSSTTANNKKMNKSTGAGGEGSGGASIKNLKKKQRIREHGGLKESPATVNNVKVASKLDSSKSLEKNGADHYGGGRGGGSLAHAAIAAGQQEAAATAKKKPVCDGEDGLGLASAEPVMKPTKKNGIAKSTSTPAGINAAAKTPAKNTTTATIGNNNTNSTPNTTSTSLPDGIPPIEGVSERTILTLAAMPLTERPRRCGECKACLNPHHKKACEVLRALGGNPIRERRKKKTPISERITKKVVNSMVDNDKEDHKKKQLHNQELNNNDDYDDDYDDIHTAKNHRNSPNASDISETAAAKRRTTRIQALGSSQATDPVNRALEKDTAATKTTAATEKPTTVVPWTSEQVAALHNGWLQVPPNAKNFWHKVAAMVPGRSANECFDKMFEKHPTPPTKRVTNAGNAGKEKKRKAEEQPITTQIGGSSKQAIANAARKIARQQRYQQKAEEIANNANDKIDQDEAEEAMEEQYNRDRYIDQILRKRRGRALGMAPHRAPPPSNTLRNINRNGRGSEVVRDVTAALATARLQEQNERDSGEESDYYWSDAE